MKPVPTPCPTAFGTQKTQGTQGLKKLLKKAPSPHPLPPPPSSNGHFNPS